MEVVQYYFAGIVMAALYALMRKPPSLLSWAVVAAYLFKNYMSGFMKPDGEGEWMAQGKEYKSQLVYDYLRKSNRDLRNFAQL